MNPDLFRPDLDGNRTEPDLVPLKIGGSGSSWNRFTPNIRPGKIFEQKRIFSSTPLLCLYFARFMGLVKKQHLSFFQKIINSLEIFPKNYWKHFNKSIGNWKYFFFVNFWGKLISSALSAEACHEALFFLTCDGCLANSTKLASPSPLSWRLFMIYMWAWLCSFVCMIACLFVRTNNLLLFPAWFGTSACCTKVRTCTCPEKMNFCQKYAPGCFRWTDGIGWISRWRKEYLRCY